MTSKNHGIELLFYKDIQDEKLILNETSEILSENAKEKAVQAAQQTGYMSLGDDSAICVRALDYFPGVHSRRWAFEESDDTSRNKKLLELMKDERDRTVYLISRFSLVDPNGNEIYKTVVKNQFEMSKEIFGDCGFGYDPILIPTISAFNDAVFTGRLKLEDNSEYEKIIRNIFNGNDFTIGCLNQEQKNAINNRGRIAKEIKMRLGGDNID